jgi:gluconolactonase
VDPPLARGGARRRRTLRRLAQLRRGRHDAVRRQGGERRHGDSREDLVYRSDGTLYFTDPPFGPPKFFEDPRRELSYSGVYCLCGGELKLVGTELAGPNGIAFSPDEKYLYIGNWDPKRKVLMRYQVRADGSLTSGRVFFDMTDAPGEDALDGIKVDRLGNVYVSGPSGPGSSRRRASIWERSAGPSTRTTWRGATTTSARSISPRKPASTESASG